MVDRFVQTHQSQPLALINVATKSRFSGNYYSKAEGQDRAWND